MAPISATAAEALAVWPFIVDRFLAGAFEAGMSSEALITGATCFSETNRSLPPVDPNGALLVFPEACMRVSGAMRLRVGSAAAIGKAHRADRIFAGPDTGKR